MIETAMVGRDGVANATSALDGKMALHRALVQLPGYAATIAPDRLRTLAHEFDPLHSMTNDGFYNFSSSLARCSRHRSSFSSTARSE